MRYIRMFCAFVGVFIAAFSMPALSRTHDSGPTLSDSGSGQFAAGATFTPYDGTSLHRASLAEHGDRPADGIPTYLAMYVTRATLVHLTPPLLRRTTSQGYAEPTMADIGGFGVQLAQSAMHWVPPN